MANDAVHDRVMEAGREPAGDIFAASEKIHAGSRGEFKDLAFLQHLASFKIWVNTDHPAKANELIGIYVDAGQARLIGLMQMALDHLKNQA